jgi:arabinogalactan endo-1,4-beta-galactosidase
VAVAILALSCAFERPHEPTKRIGIDANYALEMTERGKVWKDGAGEVDPYQLFSRHGCQSARIRLWVGDEGPNRLHYATSTALRAQRVGLKPYLVIFLSEEWADQEKQPTPVAWKGLTPERKADVVANYAERVVRHMTENGVEIDNFEIGNEIDFGICGEFEPEWPKRISLEYMRTRVWPRMVPILKAAQAGVLRVRPDARFILHLARWNEPEYAVAFWRMMLQSSVRVDEAGLSYFPTSTPNAEQQSFGYLKAKATQIVKALGRPVVICEAGYPATPNVEGQFAAWKHAVPGYPLDPDGQARWIADLMNLVRKERNFTGVYYWSPEWYDGRIWDAFALFDAHGLARPGVRSFRP